MAKIKKKINTNWIGTIEILKSIYYIFIDFIIENGSIINLIFLIYITNKGVMDQYCLRAYIRKIILII